MPFLVIAFGVLLIAAGVYHFVNPAFYNPMMPKWFPRALANAAGGVAEIIIGIGLLVPDWRTYEKEVTATVKWPLVSVSSCSWSPFWYRSFTN